MIYHYCTHAVNCVRSCFWRCLSVTFLFVHEISREPLNGFAPNSQGRRVWYLAPMCLNAKVKGQRARSPGTKKRPFSALSASCVRFIFGKTSLALVISLCLIPNIGEIKITILHQLLSPILAILEPLQIPLYSLGYPSPTDRAGGPLLMWDGKENSRNVTKLQLQLVRLYQTTTFCVYRHRRGICCAVVCTNKKLGHFQRTGTHVHVRYMLSPVRLSVCRLQRSCALLRRFKFSAIFLQH